MEDAKSSQFENILNFRDVAKFINDYAGSKKLKEDLFFRSARPDDATPSDRNLLLQTHKLRTIIDLRTKSEHLQQAEKRLANPPPSAAPLAPSNDKAADAVKIPGIDYAEINFNGSSYSRHLISQLPYLSVARLLFLYSTGYRTQAIHILGSQVMQARGLVGLAQDSLVYCTAEVRLVFQVLADKTRYPVVVHCTQGKDRTGLVVLLVLLLLLKSEAGGVGEKEMEGIRLDYATSEGELAPEREERVKEIKAIGLGEEFATCPSDWIDRVAAFVDERWGGVTKYLETCGVDGGMQGRVREILLA